MIRQSYLDHTRLPRIKKYEKHLNQYNVILMNIQIFLSVVEFSVDDMISYLQSEVIEELSEVFGFYTQSVKG